MIKLFRNIRRNLLNEGKTSKYAKYFRYAFGEIVLLVIGILIALQINNYNNSQLDKSLRQQYLQGLKSELVMDLGNWNGKKKENKQSIEIMRQVIDEVMDENPRAISSKSSINLIIAMISQPLPS